MPGRSLLFVVVGGALVGCLYFGRCCCCGCGWPLLLQRLWMQACSHRLMLFFLPFTGFCSHWCWHLLLLSTGYTSIIIIAFRTTHSKKFPPFNACNSYFTRVKDIRSKSSPLYSQFSVTSPLPVPVQQWRKNKQKHEKNLRWEGTTKHHKKRKQASYNKTFHNLTWTRIKKACIFYYP
jgi:hypothetical protein